MKGKGNKELQPSFLTELITPDWTHIEIRPDLLQTPVLPSEKCSPQKSLEEPLVVRDLNSPFKNNPVMHITIDGKSRAAGERPEKD